jgi:RNA polymerase sigma factor (sigma-70 family)
MTSRTESERLQWLARHILPYEPRARSWLKRHARTLSNADADDIIQEAYARVWVLEYRLIRHPRAYFATMIRNLVAEYARRARIVPMERMGEIEALTLISEEPGPERHASARNQLDELRNLLDTLPIQCRRAFELRKFEGLTIEQTAKAMGVTDSAVEKLLARALARILAAMNEDNTTRECEAGRSDERARQYR